jgi:hypothetical protein
MRLVATRISPFAFSIVLVLFGGFVYCKSGDAMVAPAARFWLLAVGVAFLLTVVDLVEAE